MLRPSSRPVTGQRQTLYPGDYTANASFGSLKTYKSMLLSPSNHRADCRPVRFQTTFICVMSLYCSMLVTTERSFALPGDAFVATLVHASLGHLVCSSSACAFLSTAGGGAIRSLRRSGTTLFSVVVELIKLVAPCRTHC